MARSDQGRLAYADLLRVFACLAVIVVHVSGGWLESLPAGTADWNLLNAWDCLAHWCVPVFVMCSGMFLLDPKKSLAWPHLLFRYLLRVAVALVFWGVVYALMNTALFRGLTLRGVLDALYAVVLGSVPTHLWFLYMVAGLYLLTPPAPRLRPGRQAQRFPLVLSGGFSLRLCAAPVPAAPGQPDGGALRQ